MHRHLMPEQPRHAAAVFERVAGDWFGHVAPGDVGPRTPEIGRVLAFSKLREGLEFPETPEGD